MTLLGCFLDVEMPAAYRNATLSKNALAVVCQNPLVLTLMGSPGTGKTFTAWAMYAALRKRQVMGWTEAVIEDLRTREWVQWVGDDGRHRNTDAWMRIVNEAEVTRHRFDHAWLDKVAHHPSWLIVDDIGFRRPDDWMIEAAYVISGTRIENRKHTVYTTNLTADEMRQQYSAAIASRIMSGVVLDTSGIDRRLVEQ